MKKSLSILALALLLGACSKTENTQPMTDTNSQPAPSTQSKQVQTTHHTASHDNNQSKTNTQASSVVDKLVSLTGGDKSEMIKKSTQIMDIWALQNAMSKNGMKPDDGVKWQTRLAQAQNEQEVKAILSEQIAKLTITVSELEKVQLKDPQIIAIKDNLQKGTQTILNAEKQFVAMDFNDPNLNSKVMPITQEMLHGGQMVMRANDDFIKLVNSLGFKTNEEAVAYYEHYKAQFEQFKNNQ